MNISKIEVYKYSIPIHPFTIATGTMYFAQNILVKIHTDTNLIGWGECSAFPMIVGETQETCFAMAKDFAQIWLGKPAMAIEDRIAELHLCAANNYTIKSAFDMALYDVNAQYQKKPMYKFLGGKEKKLISDITVGISDKDKMAQQALEFKNNGASVLKIKLGKTANDDIERIKTIRTAVGPDIKIRIDANQGYTKQDAVFVLKEIEKYNIEFCEQPMRTYDDYFLPELRKQTQIKIMADESVYTHHNAKQIIFNQAADYINIKFAKSGGFNEAIKICEVAQKNDIPCMMGGMLESRLALTAFAHFASANDIIQFYDLDTCLLGHKVDPVVGGAQFADNYELKLNNEFGLGAKVHNDYLNNIEQQGGYISF